MPTFMDDRRRARPVDVVSEAGSGDAHRRSAARPAAPGSSRRTTSNGMPTALNMLQAAVDEVATTDLDVLDEAGVRRLLGGMQHAIDRLTGLRTRAAGLLESRALRAAGPGREQQALREVRDRTSIELRLTPSQVKQAGQTGRRLAETPAAQDALTSGELPADHARVLGDTLQHLSGHDRDRAQHVLLDAARREDARTFGRTCRRLLAETDAESAQLAQDRRHARRHLRVTETADGMLAMHGQGSGWDAEVVATALHAFARPAARDTRSTEQRSWDALVNVCRTALDAGEAPANRGVRPHVLITVPHPLVTGGPTRDASANSARTRATDAGGPTQGIGVDSASRPATDDASAPIHEVVETAWTGPLPWTEVRRYLIDVGVSRLLVDAEGLPLEASETVRTVPRGLWEALQIRDRTCIAEGCSVPAAWCQVMHLDAPYRYDGRLSLDNGAAGCSRHHRLLDRHGWCVTWIEGRPVLHHPERPPRRPAEPPDDRPTVARAPDAPVRAHPPPASGTDLPEP